MVFQIQRVSEHGSGTAAVARTALQGFPIVDEFSTPSDQKDACKQVLMDLQGHLVRCVAISDRVRGEIAAAKQAVALHGLKTQSMGQVVEVPSVIDLQAQAESFLEGARLAIADIARLIEPFYGGPANHKFHRLIDWSAKKFGHDDPLTQTARDWRPWVERVVDMRNAVDHPKGGPEGRLWTKNFQLAVDSQTPKLIEPSWGLTDAPPVPIASSMESIIEGAICLGECILVALFEKLKSSTIHALMEIPRNQRSPSNPLRFRLTLVGMPIPDGLPTPSEPSP